jgi:hypothetical protein
MTSVVAERRRLRAPLHFRRVELKYIVPERQVTELVDRISPYLEWDPFLVQQGRKSYSVSSLYFDSFNLESLFEKEAGWLSRRRIRLRTYDESFTVGTSAFLEIKRRHDFLVSKDRFPVTLDDDVLDTRAPGMLRRLMAAARERQHPAAEEAMVMEAWFNLRPTALVCYDRIAFVSPADRDLRLTIDRRLKGSWLPQRLDGPITFHGCGIHPTLGRLMSYGAHQSRGPNPLRSSEYVIVELKFAHGIPAWMHQILMNMNMARSAYSKYAFVVRDLRPNLFEAFDDED